MFVLSMIWGVIIVGRVPTHGEYAGGAIILVSVISSLVEKKTNTMKQVISSTPASEDMTIEGGVGSRAGPPQNAYT